MRRLGDRPMTSSERQRRYLDKLVSSKPPPAPPPAPADLIIKVDHIRLYPDRIARWLCERLGRAATLAFYKALGRALAVAPEEPDPPEDA